jgi:diguanylate cyclase (GGDEF)-like protein/PAS domain S-box-containing protein
MRRATNKNQESRFMPQRDAKFAIQFGKPLSAAVGVFLVALMAMALIVWKLEQRAVQAERLHDSELAGNHANAVQVSIERALSATYAVAAIVRQGKGQVTDFEGLASEMLPLYPGISSLALSPGGVVRYVAPLSGNERALGFDQLNDPLQGPEARRGRDSGQLTLAGPLDLVQGGLGIVGRLPIFLDTADGKPQFWGLISVVIRFPQALAGARLDQLKSDGLHYELWRIHPDTRKKQVIAASTSEPLKDPTEHSFNLPNGTWTLSVAPVAGWGSKSDVAFTSGVAIFLSLLLAYAAKLFVELNENRAGQEALVADKTRGMAAYQAKLQATLDAIPDLILEAGLDGTFYDYQAPRAAANYPPPEFFLNHNATHVLPAEAALALLTALRQADESGHSDGQELFIDQAQGRRWYEISVSRKQGVANDEAAFIVLARDITQRKQAETDLRVSATAFDSQLGMAITDASERVLRINQAFTDITSYTEDEVVGKTLSFLDSGRHEAAFYEEMLETVRKTRAWRGEIWNRRKNGEIFPSQCTMTAVRADDGTVTHFINSLTDITQMKATEEEINKLAFYDPLTGLPNRRMLLDRLRLAMAESNRTGRIGALQFIDLDNFKTLNDTLGHDMGDLLLQQVGQRLKKCMREGDTVARLGGDEFVVMLKELSTDLVDAAAQAEIVGGKILAGVGEPYRLAGLEYQITPSIGITHFRGFEAKIDDLLKQADLAMYQAKALGRNAMQFFDPSMQSVVTARVALESDIRHGIAQGQFVLYFQPQISGDNRTTGAEVLLRWPHPTRGMVPPNEFIPLAEDTSLILPLGNWVLETACNQLTAWAKDPGTEHLTLAVNVSARQFRQQDFVSYVSDLIQYTGANPRRLKLELTESMLVKDVEDTIAKMVALKAQGIGFSLDDFGTGYSSLSYLKRLPLDQLKIDQSFVRDLMTDPNDASIARTVIALGHSLGLNVIAEGVETAEQRAFLAAQGCDAYQGYLFGKPMPIDNFNQFLSSH